MPTSFSCQTASALVLCAISAVTGCTKVEEPPPGPGAVIPKSSGEPAATKVDPNRLTKAECTKLFDHFLNVAVDDMVKRKAPNMTPEQKAKASQPLRIALKSSTDFTKRSDECEREYSRPEYDCMLRSTTEREFDGCLSRNPSPAPSGSP